LHLPFRVISCVALVVALQFSYRKEFKMRNRFSLWISSAVMLITLSGTTVAFAEPQQPEGAAQHCVGHAMAISEEKTPMARLGPPVFLPLVGNATSGDDTAAIECYSTFAEAIYAATGGVIIAADAAPDTVDAAMINAPAATSTVIGIMYQDENKGGASYTWTQPNTVGCSTGIAYAAPKPPTSFWNDRVSSAVAFGGCERWYFYENTNYGGAALVCTSSSCTGSGSMGIMSDDSSSWRWYKSGLHY
jgi:hypothetical protein